jgi:hypothetical protein
VSNAPYVPIRRRTREDLLAHLSSGNSGEVHDALLSAAYWDDDWRWAQQQLVSFADSNDDKILWAVALGLGFVAVFHGEIDEETVEPILTRIKTRPSLADVAQGSLEEIDHFVRRRRAGEDIPLGERLPKDWQPPSGHFKQDPGQK